MDRDKREQLWERYVGEQSPVEFLAMSQPATPRQAAEGYVAEMVRDNEVTPSEKDELVDAFTEVIESRLAAAGEPVTS